MDDLLGLIVFAVIALIGLVGKIRKKPDEELPSSPPAETPELEDLPETLRRLFTGEPFVPKARPATPRQPAEAEPVIIVAPPRQRTPYQPPVARPAAPRESAPSSPRPVARPMPQPPVKKPAQPVVCPVANEEGPRPRFGQLVQQPRMPLRTQRPSSAPASTARAAQPSAPRSPGAGHPAREREGVRKPEVAHALLRNLDDARRGIILSELLGPPLSLR